MKNKYELLPNVSLHFIMKDIDDGYWLLEEYFNYNKEFFENKFHDFPCIAYNQELIKNCKFPSYFVKSSNFPDGYAPSSGIIIITPTLVIKSKMYISYTLLHEMIHQYIDVVLKEKVEPNEHGDLFVDRANKIASKKGWGRIYPHTEKSHYWPFKNLSQR